MSLLPIVKRELILAARKPLMYYGRAAVGGAAGMMGLGFLIISVSSGRLPAELGRDLFLALSGFAFFCSLLAGVALTADCISGEKRTGSLDLIFLAGVRSHDLVLGKLAATLLPSFYALLAMLPISAWAFFLGGISPGEFGRMALVLGHALFFALAAGLFGSALCRDGRKAILLAILLIAVVAGVIPIAAFAAGPAGNGMGVFGWLRWGSPGYGFLLVLDWGGRGSEEEFWRVLLGIELLSAGLLAGASVGLNYSWREHPGPAGLKEVKRKRRRPPGIWLEMNPMLWLETRHSAPGWWGLLLFGLVFLILKLVSGGTLGGGLRWDLILFLLYFLHVGMKLWVAWEAGRRFAEDRRNGALELLLSSPLDERTIVRGWLVGMKRRFVGPAAALLFLDFGLFWIAARWFPDPIWGFVFLLAGALFVADLYALAWVGIWQGLVARNPLQAFLRTCGLILFLPALFFFGGLGVIGLFGSGFQEMATLGELALFWFLFSLVFSLGFCGWSIHRLADNFRVMTSLSGGK